MAAETKTPEPAIVEKAIAKQDAGEDLNQREARALEAQHAIDAERGWRRVEWKPGISLLQHLATQHTVPDSEAGELEMRRIHNEWTLGQSGQ